MYRWIYISLTSVQSINYVVFFWTDVMSFYFDESLEIVIVHCICLVMIMIPVTYWKRTHALQYDEYSYWRYGCYSGRLHFTCNNYSYCAKFKSGSLMLTQKTILSLFDLGVIIPIETIREIFSYDKYGSGK